MPMAWVSRFWGLCPQLLPHAFGMNASLSGAAPPNPPPRRSLHDLGALRNLEFIYISFLHFSIYYVFSLCLLFLLPDCLYIRH